MTFFIVTLLAVIESMRTLPIYSRQTTVHIDVKFKLQLIIVRKVYVHTIKSSKFGHYPMQKPKFTLIPAVTDSNSKRQSLVSWH